MEAFRVYLFGVADDLTGANVTAAHLVRGGWRARVIARAGLPAPPGIEDALIVNTGSRALGREQAYRQVRDTIEGFGALGSRLLTKRVDSTARGNLGSEIDAALDASGRRLCWVVVADPVNGKRTVDGRLTIGGVPVDQAAAALDTLHPVRTAAVTELVRAQSRHRILPLPLRIVRSGAGPALSYIRKAGGGPLVVVCDCAASEDLAALADLAAEAGEPAVAVDPGAFTASLAARLSPLPRPPAFLVCGSIHANVRAQLDEITKDSAVRLLEVVPGHARTPAFRDVLDGWIEETLRRPSRPVVGVHSSFDHAPETGADDQIVEDLAAVADSILARLPRAPAGLVLTGGQTAAAVCARLGIGDIVVAESVVPYAVAGIVGGGRWSGLPVVTKGGLIGDRTALRRAVQYLRALGDAVPAALRGSA
jgi:uncharacterized protein YgbK (DUF1537 family)